MPIRRLSILAIVALPTVALALAAGTYRDAASSLTWQDPPGTSANDDMMSWAEAKAYCAQLELGGVSDWRLPSIDELRSLVRNSPKTQSGGACGVKAGCLGGLLPDRRLRWRRLRWLVLPLADGPQGLLQRLLERLRERGRRRPGVARPLLRWRPARRRHHGLQLRPLREPVGAVRF